MFTKGLRKFFYLGLTIALTIALTTGCKSQSTAKMPPSVAEVKAIQVIQEDVPITYEYVGQIEAKEEVKLQAKVSGNIIAKLVNGGDLVQKGQVLFRLDQRQYNASLLSAKAQLAQAEAALNNSRLDTIRYKKLLEQDAVAQQTVDTQLAVERQNAAVVAANRAMVQLAQDNLQDTVIVAPISGRIGVNILDVGSFVQAGSTSLATISSVDPVFVRFSISENEYLQMAKKGNSAVAGTLGNKLKLILSDGSRYPLTGQITQIDRGLAENTGTLTLKAVFSNPQRILVPGMFARVVAEGEIQKGALLVPQRAVQQLLDKTFITVVGEGDKAESRPVKMGAKIGNLWLVEEGLSPNDRIVVEGLTKVQPGMALKVTMIGLEDLQSPVKQ